MQTRELWKAFSGSQFFGQSSRGVITFGSPVTETYKHDYTTTGAVGGTPIFPN